MFVERHLKINRGRTVLLRVTYHFCRSVQHLMARQQPLPCSALGGSPADIGRALKEAWTEHPNSCRGKMFVVTLVKYIF